MATSDWARSQLSTLITLDTESITQLLDYASTLSNDAAAEHLKQLLGDSPKSLEFISSYNARRNNSYDLTTTQSASLSQDATQATGNGPSRSTKGPQGRRKNAKPSLHQQPARRVEGHGNITGGYQKAQEEDYMAASSRPVPNPHNAALANALTLNDTPDAIQLPKKTAGPTSSTSTTNFKQPPSAASNQLSPYLPNVRTKTSHSSHPFSRTSSPAPSKTTVSIPGGTAGHGASTTLEDLDSAIRSLEIQTNPTLSSSANSKSSKDKDRERKCACNATRHPLLLAAPNCLNCGKIVCVKEGLGPCTFCAAPLLGAGDVQAMLTELKQERGIARQNRGNAGQKRADVATNIGLAGRSGAAAGGLDKAMKHRDTLLNYQAENAQRTTVRDEAADYDTTLASSGGAGAGWMTPAQRAKEVARQQKVLREREWETKPEYEKRNMVLNIEVGKGGKSRVVKGTGKKEKEKEIEEPDAADEEVSGEEVGVGHVEGSGVGGGAFSRNPLLGNGLVRPIWKPQDEKGKERATETEEPTRRKGWRRVQDDYEDNEGWILDGGVYGGRGDEFGQNAALGAEEHAYG